MKLMDQSATKMAVMKGVVKGNGNQRGMFVDDLYLTLALYCSAEPFRRSLNSWSGNHL